MSKIAEELREEDENVRQLAPGVRAFVPKGETYDPGEHVVSVDPRYLPRMHRVDGELTSLGKLHLRIVEKGDLESLDLLWECPIDSQRADYELEINCENPLKYGNQRYNAWQNQTSAVLSGPGRPEREIAIKRVYCSNEQSAQ